MDTEKLAMDNESEYSVATDRSERSRHSHKRHRTHERSGRRHKNRGTTSNGNSNGPDDVGGEKCVTIRTPPNDEHNDSRASEGVVKLDIPEDDNWGETNTFISGTTDVTQLSHESLAKLTKDKVSPIGFHDPGFIATVIVAFFSFLSPIAIVVIPQTWMTSNPFQNECGTSCKGTFIGMVFKLVILLAASWAIFFRRQRTSMPSVFIFRVGILLGILLLTLTYWLFFAIWVVEPRESNYENIVSFADSFTNCLLFVHYLSLVLLELRQLQTTFVLEVIRSTDGERRFYNVGDLSIQRCAVWVLEKYYCDFPVYNPALMRAPSRSSRMKQVNQSFKVYDVDGGQTGEDTTGQKRAMLAAVARRRDAGHNERYYEEAEYERRVRKRKARLVAATEDAFAHIKRAPEHERRKLAESVMDPKLASEAIFPALARSLQKYLRTTRQHQHYDITGIYEHLATCIKYDMAPKAFLQRYIHPGPYLTYDPRHDSSQWEVISDSPLIKMLKDGVVFRLRQNDYSLVITAHRTPRIRLKEKFIDNDSHHFVLQMQSETSV